MTDAPRTSPDFVSWLVARHPDLVPVLNEHLPDNDELLPHVLFGDVTRHALALARHGEVDELNRLLGDLDAALDVDGRRCEPGLGLLRRERIVG